MKKIVKGNDFTLKIPVMKSVEGQKVPFPLPACTDVQVRVCNQFKRISLSYEVDVENDNIILARVEGDQIPLGVYAIEVRGKILGNDWRSEEYPQFEIVARNADADLEFGETDEGDNSVEMDTALVILPPSVDLSNLITKAEETITKTEKAIEEVKAASSSIDDSEAERAKAEEQRMENEKERAKAEKLRADAESDRVSNENQRKSREDARNSAEDTRLKAEIERNSREEHRVADERERVSNESTRKNAEQQRISNESARDLSEGDRAKAEAARSKAEKDRVGEEDVRVESEKKRVSAEQSRVDAEGKRVLAEEARVLAEKKREIDFSNAKSECETATDNANTAANNTKEAIQKCEAATTGAETVDARLDGNVLTVTNRRGEEKSVNLTDSDEHVTVNLITKVSDVTTEGLVLFVYINNGADPKEYTADSNGQVEFTVNKGATYRIVFPALKGCNPINPIQHIAAVGSRIIDAEYVAETEKVEHVTVKVKKADEKDTITPWERFNVYLTLDGKKTTYETGEEGKVEFDVKNGKQYTVSVDSQDGMYEQYFRSSVTRTAMADSYRFNYLFRPYEAGIWLIDDENNRYTYDEWAESGNDAQKLMFVCIKTLATQRYNGDIYIGLDALKEFSKTAVSKQWCPQNVLFNNIPSNGQNTALTTWSEFAYNGLHATETIIAEGDERELATPACDYAYSFKVVNGDLTYQGYLPTCYQWTTAWNNIDLILDMLSLKFPDMTFTKSMFSNTKWTSTQGNAAFSCGFGTNVYNDFKFNSCLAVPFFACLSPS